jgi:hypothetical protein
MQIIPLQAIPSQTFNITLNSQACTIDVYQKTFYSDNNETNTQVNIVPVFLDLYVSGVLIIGGVLCLNANRIVRDTYLGFVGDLAFYDQQGSSDPIYTGFGDRYLLVYLAPGDV